MIFCTMAANPEVNRNAWRPLTFGGVAAFASATWKRLLLVQFLFAILVAGTTVWFLQRAWFPTIQAAIRELPSEGEVQSGRVNWPDQAPRLLAEGRFLAFIIDLEHTGAIRSPAQVQVEIGRTDVRCISLFGQLDFPYSKEWIIALNRGELEPRWGAWRAPALWLVFVATIAVLFVNWTVLQTIFFLPAWLVGFFANRRLSPGGSWKMAGAALMPGVLIMVGAIFLYGVGFLDLVQFLAAFAGHLLVDLIFVLVSPLFAPAIPSLDVRGNPFVPPAAEKEKKNGETPPSGT
jgi:hypothetical protein